MQAVEESTILRTGHLVEIHVIIERLSVAQHLPGRMRVELAEFGNAAQGNSEGGLIAHGMALFQQIEGEGASEPQASDGGPADQLRTLPAIVFSLIQSGEDDEEADAVPEKHVVCLGQWVCV